MRRHAFTMFVIAGIGLLSGCAAQMSKSIEQRVDVSEQCRQVQEDPLPDSPVIPGDILSGHLGSFGSCEVWLKDESKENSVERKEYKLLPLCAFAQLQTKYEHEFSDSKATNIKKDITAKFQTVVARLESLRDQVDSTTTNLKSSITQPEATRMVSVINAINAVNVTAIRKDLGDLRVALNELRQAIDKGSQEISQQAATELAAWDTNFRTTLEQFERLLSGDYRVVINDTLKNQVIVHTARRSLDLLHSSLRPADALINKLDQQGYGAVSVGYMVFGPDIQKTVNKAKVKIKGIYEGRLKKAGSNDNRYMKKFMWEMRRAACSNLQQGTQFTMLTEIVDTFFIMDIEDNDNNQTIVKEKLPAYDATGPAYGTRELVGSFSDAYALMVDGQSDCQCTSKQVQATPNDSAPLHVSLANEWAARHLLLMEKMEARVKASARPPEKDKDGKELPQKIIFPTIEQVDEAMVTRIADAASAKVIDDATRSAPALLISQQGTGPDTKDLHVAIANNINISAAASAVSQASATINANFNVSNTNTFNPTNTVAPIINVPPYPGTSSGAGREALESFCASTYFSGQNAACVRDGHNYVVTFPNRSFGNEACSSPGIDDELKDLAKAVTEFANKNQTRFNAAISGYASSLAAPLKNCGYQLAPRCTYVNQIRNVIKIEGCPAAPGKDDGNRMLSAARAHSAAKTLEQAARGVILVKALSAQGADGAYGDANENLDLDRTIVVHLQPAR